MEFFLKQLFAGLGIDPAKMMAEAEKFAKEAKELGDRLDQRLAALEANDKELLAEVNRLHNRIDNAIGEP